MHRHQEPPAGVPEWIVTFGDMMSLMLIFFILLVSMSDFTSEKKFREVSASLRDQFGTRQSLALSLPAGVLPRDPDLAKLLAAARSRREKLRGERETSADRSLSGQTAVNPLVSLAFSPRRDELTAIAAQSLRSCAADLSGAIGSIEIRGYAATELGSESDAPNDSHAVAFARCQRVRSFLTAEARLAPGSIRVVVIDLPPFHSTIADSSPNFRHIDSVDIYFLEGTD